MSYRDFIETHDCLLTIDPYRPTHVFRKVQEPTQGYIIWPIGRENFDFPGYIPMARPMEDFRIDSNSLQALDVGNEDFALWLLKMAVRGKLRGEFSQMRDKYFMQFYNEQKAKENE